MVQILVQFGREQGHVGTLRVKTPAALGRADDRSALDKQDGHGAEDNGFFVHRVYPQLRRQGWFVVSASRQGVDYERMRFRSSVIVQLTVQVSVQIRERSTGMGGQHAGGCNTGFPLPSGDWGQVP